MNLVIVSHCDFHGNSGIHAWNVARGLHARGISVAVCVPDHPDSVRDLGDTPFAVLGYDAALEGGLSFPDGRGADLIHAFTPREHVRKLTEHLAARHRCRYVVHLEDHEEIIVADELGGLDFTQLRKLPAPIVDRLISPWRTHPVRGQYFLEGAAGVTALIDRLLEFKPEGVPGVVFWPGFDPAFLAVGDDRLASRKSFGLADDDLVLVYTGNVHQSNVAEVRSLLLAVGMLRRRGLPVRLARTGKDHVDMSWVQSSGLSRHVRDLGFVARARLPRLLEAADILVQPGGANAFNAYRFPSKLPEFLAAGRPVVLPCTNIGRFVTDRTEALLLDAGDADDICAKVLELHRDAPLRARLSREGRRFARSRLSWEGAADTIERFYREIGAFGAHDAIAPVVPVDAADARRAPTAEAAARASLSPSPPPSAPKPRLIAFHLPQFHPTPENDEWWGRGFTEWTNVTRAKPSFAGHDQPQLPADLGFYDLRLPETLEQQALLAQRYGIHAFAFYYYWFGGRRILERPIDQMLASGRPDFPFCLCWANENWTRRWDGQDSEILLRQDYEPGWAEHFISDMLPALLDRRYLRVGDAPMLLVYRADVIPDVEAVVNTWREHVRRRAGIELHVCAVQSFGLGDPRRYGMDAAVEFPPHTNRHLLPRDAVKDLVAGFEGYLEDYPAVVRDQLSKPLPGYRWYRGAMPAWDNTARRGLKAHILVDATPERYQRWLQALVAQALGRSEAQEPFVFVNAWNEWAEGTHLEPDQRNGHRLLQATATALVAGVVDYYRDCGFEISPSQAARHLGIDWTIG
ncbi:MAG: glycoside hydrolase family 99-like domain-containing protein [Lautropia sp.]